MPLPRFLLREKRLTYSGLIKEYISPQDLVCTLALLKQVASAPLFCALDVGSSNNTFVLQSINCGGLIGFEPKILFIERVPITPLTIKGMNFGRADFKLRQFF